MKARESHISIWANEGCAETWEFYIDIGRFLTQLDRDRGLPKAGDGDVYVVIEPLPGIPALPDSIWKISVGSTFGGLTFYATEVPLSAPGPRGRSYYGATDSSRGLPMPIWSGPELSIFDQNPTTTMRKNPQANPTFKKCRSSLNVLVSFGGFCQWLGTRSPWRNFRNGALSIRRVEEDWEGEFTSAAHWELGVVELEPGWRSTRQTYKNRLDSVELWALKIPLTKRGYYRERLTGDLIEYMPVAPGALNPLWSAPNGAFYVYDWNVWEEIYV